MRPQLLTALVVIVLLLMVPTTQQEITQMTAGTAVSLNQHGSTYAYYSITMPLTRPLLAITIDSEDFAYTQIFISSHISDSNEAYYERPNRTHYTQECDQYSFDTCMVSFDVDPTKSVTVYFSVHTEETFTYSLIAVPENYYKIKLKSTYTIKFNKAEGAVFRIKGAAMIGIEELVVVLTYNTAGKMGRFKMRAGLNELPNKHDSRLSGKTVGAYSKVMKLPAIAVNDTYYMLLEGEEGTNFTLYSYDSHPKHPHLSINSSLLYYTEDNMTYTARSSFSNMDMPLHVGVSAYFGEGKFTIDYCDGMLKTTFENEHGQNGEVGITPVERNACKVIRSSKKHVDEPLKITVEPKYDMGFQVQLYEGYITEQLRINEEMYGIFFSSQASRKYQIHLPPGQNQPILLQYRQLDQKQRHLQFEIQQCDFLGKQCTIISTSKEQPGTELSFTPKSPHTYQLVVSYATLTTKLIEYEIFMYRQTIQSQLLQPGKLYTDQIEENQYQFYEINLTQVKTDHNITIPDLSQLVIQVKEFNGQVTLLTSLTVSQPTYQEYRKSNEVKSAWTGKQRYLVNETTQMVYIGIYGYEEALYNIQYSIDVDSDIPAKYTRLIQDSSNQVTLDDQYPYILYAYETHIVPYQVWISGDPACIKFGDQLPLDQTCHTTLPSDLHLKKLYLNISKDPAESSNDIKVTIYSGTYFINSDPLLVACLDACYEPVEILLMSQPVNIIHKGQGQIQYHDERAHNGFLTVTCPDGHFPCFQEINASLPYGGDMVLSRQQEGIIGLDYQTQSVTLGKWPKKFFFQISRWSQTTSFSVYSEGVQVIAYYNLSVLQEQNQNIRSYSFPNPYSYMKKSQGNPLRKIHVVKISEELINQLDCQDYTRVCVVAVSLYANLDVQYSKDYYNKGVAHISTNTYRNSLPFYASYSSTGQFSMTEFNHHFSRDEDIPQKIRVEVQPISNCHPKLYPGTNQNSINFVTPSYNSYTTNSPNIYNWFSQYSVVSEKPCKYKITLSDLDYPHVHHNSMIRLSLPYEEAPNHVYTHIVLLTYPFYQTIDFTVKVATQQYNQAVQSILLNQINRGKQPQVPQQLQYDYGKFWAHQVRVQDYHGGAFLVSISTQSPTITLTVRNDNQALTLLAGQEYRQKLVTKANDNIRIKALGSIRLWFTTTEGLVHMAVRKNYNSTVIYEKTRTESDSPWIFINSSSTEITTFDINLHNLGDIQVSVEMWWREGDSMSLTPLYQGIILYDAFTQVNKMNCYRHHSPQLLGIEEIKVNLVMEGAPRSHSKIQGSSSIIKLQVSSQVSTDRQFISSSVEEIRSAKPLTYRVTVPFSMNQNYTICFYTDEEAFIGHEYYVLLEDSTMPHLVEGQNKIVKSNSRYDMYELVEEGVNEHVMISLTSCLPEYPESLSEKSLFGSSSFKDADQGRFTDLVDYHKNIDTIFAKLSVNEGYYYLGVKKKVTDIPNYAPPYSISFQNVTSASRLLADAFGLTSRKINQVYNKGHGLQVKIPAVALLKGIGELDQNGITINYTLYTEHQYKGYESLGSYVRCPGFRSQPHGQLMQYTQGYHYRTVGQFTSNHFPPTITIHLAAEHLNVSGKVEVRASSQVLTYYYDNNDIWANNTTDDAIGSLLASLLILTSVALFALSAYICYKKWKKRAQAADEPDFELDDMENTPQGRTALVQGS